MLEYDFSTTLDFGGIATTEAEAAIKRASKGGLCSTSELKGAVSLFLGVICPMIKLSCLHCFLGVYIQ
jgi:hypothetical protein